MKLFKKVLAGVAVAAAMASASASIINVGGVSWDPDAAFNISVNSAATVQQLGNTLIPSGFGRVTEINSLNTFCSGCELTFTFDSFVNAGAPTYVPSANTSFIGFTGGVFKFYVDTAQNALGNNLSLSTASDGVLWLTLDAHVDPVSGYSLAATFNGQNAATARLLTGSGFLDVRANGGSATGNFDTNTLDYGTDLYFSSSFNSQIAPVPQGFAAAQLGTSSLSGHTIPEPESLALVGLGLLGLAAARRRKAA